MITKLSSHIDGKSINYGLKNFLNAIYIASTVITLNLTFYVALKNPGFYKPINNEETDDLNKNMYIKYWITDECLFS